LGGSAFNQYCEVAGLPFGDQRALLQPCGVPLGDLTGADRRIGLLPGTTECFGRLQRLASGRIGPFDSFSTFLPGAFGRCGALPGAMLGLLPRLLSRDPTPFRFGSLGMRRLDSGHSGSLDLIQPSRHRSQRRGQRVNRPAYGVQVVPEAFGVQPERGASGVQT
jgi:hypothetical protein